MEELESKKDIVGRESNRERSRKRAGERERERSSECHVQENSLYSF